MLPVQSALNAALALYVLLGAGSWGYTLLRIGWPSVRALELEYKKGWGTVLGTIFSLTAIGATLVLHFSRLTRLTFLELFVINTCVFFVSGILIFTVKRKFISRKRMTLSVPKRIVSASIIAKKAMMKLPQGSFVKEGAMFVGAAGEAAATPLQVESFESITSPAQTWGSVTGMSGTGKDKKQPDATQANAAERRAAAEAAEKMRAARKTPESKKQEEQIKLLPAPEHLPKIWQAQPATAEKTKTGFEPPTIMAPRLQAAQGAAEKVFPIAKQSPPAQAVPQGKGLERAGQEQRQNLFDSWFKARPGPPKALHAAEQSPATVGEAFAARQSPPTAGQHAVEGDAAMKPPKATLAQRPQSQPGQLRPLAGKPLVQIPIGQTGTQPRLVVGGKQEPQRQRVRLTFAARKKAEEVLELLEKKATQKADKAVFTKDEVNKETEISRTFIRESLKEMIGPELSEEYRGMQFRKVERERPPEAVLPKSAMLLRKLLCEEKGG